MGTRDMARIWFITGVSSGLGRSLARAVTRVGDTVVGTVRSEQDRVAFEQDVAAEALILDVTDTTGVRAAVAEVEAQHGRIDILVNNAGNGMTGAIEETGLDQVRLLFEVNLLGPLALIQAALPGMRARRSGHIVNVTSISGFKGWAGTGVYCASKFALEGLGQTLAQEVEPLGIRVTNVQPGSLRTAFQGAGLAKAEGIIDDYAVSAHRARHILNGSHGKQAGDPDRAAEMIVRMVDAPKVPLNFLLGADAIGTATGRIGQILADLGRWAPLGEAIAFEPAQPFLRE